MLDALSSLPTSKVLLVAILVAAVLIYVPFGAVAYARVQSGWVAMESPRAMVDKLPAYAQRATAAHQNGFEAFSIFTAAALMAYVTGETSPIASLAAIGFVVARLFYPLFYILNIVPGRSMMFAIGSLCITTLFYLSLT